MAYNTEKKPLTLREANCLGACPMGKSSQQEWKPSEQPEGVSSPCCSHVTGLCREPTEEKTGVGKLTCNLRRRPGGPI